MERSKSVVFFVAYTLYFFSLWTVLAYFPLLLKSYQFSDQQIGFAVGLNSLASILLVLPFGIFSDCFSPRRALTVGAFLFSLYFLLLLVTRDFGALCFVIVLGGVGAAAVRVLLMSLYLKVMDQRERGKRVAFLQLGGYVGFGLGPLAGGWLYENWGAEAMIAGAFFLSLVVSGLTLFVKDAPAVVFSFKDYRNDFKAPDALFLIVAVFVLGTHFGTEQAGLSLLMNHVVGLGKEEIGIVFFVLGVWMALLVPFAGVWADRRQQAFILLLVGLLVSSTFQFVTAFVGTFHGLLAVRMIHTVGDTLAILESDVLTARFFPGARLGGNSGLIFCVRTTAIFLFAAFAGWLSQRWGYKMPFVVNGTMVFALTLVGLAYRRGATQACRGSEK